MCGRKIHRVERDAEPWIQEDWSGMWGGDPHTAMVKNPDRMGRVVHRDGTSCSVADVDWLIDNLERV